MSAFVLFCVSDRVRFHTITRVISRRTPESIGERASSCQGNPARLGWDGTKPNMDGNFAQNLENALNRMRARLAAHGGDIALVDADERTGVVRVRFCGACDGCPFASLTLEGLIEEGLMQVNGVTEVIAVGDTSGVSHDV